jgi:heterogeneous nuclear ribonucleoprotein F/H
MQGLPYTATEDDVAQFFEGIKLLGVYFTHGPSGRRSGNAFAEFQSDFDLTKGLSPNKQHIWAMCVWRGHGPTTAAPAAAVPSPALSPGLSATLSPVGYPPLHFVRLRGLPYDCQAGDIKYFFRDGGVVPLGVFLSIRKGEAFAEFASGSECAHALSLDRGYIGRRYVEIFMSSPDEVSRFAQHPPPPLAPQKPYPHPYDQPVLAAEVLIVMSQSSLVVPAFTWSVSLIAPQRQMYSSSSAAFRWFRVASSSERMIVVGRVGKPRFFLSSPRVSHPTRTPDFWSRLVRGDSFNGLVVGAHLPLK